MSELYPLSHLAVPGAGRPVGTDSAITLAERRPGSIAEFAFWDAGTPIPKSIVPGSQPEPNRAVTTPGHVFLSVAPGRYMAIGQDSGLAERLEAAIPITDGTVVDLTHGRAGLRVTGVPAADLLQKGLSFDLNIDAFPPMAATNGGLHHMSVTVIRLDADVFDVFVMTSLAGSLWDWVTDAAVEYGWQVAAPVI
jgi:methylglutamate dehydrogenase subunit D